MQIWLLCTFLTNSATRRVLCCLLLLLGTVGFHSAALAANGEACMPWGFGVNNGSPPSSNFTAKGPVTTQIVRYRYAWQPPLPQTGDNCIRDSDASLYIYPDFSGTFFNAGYSSQANLVTNGVELIFEAYDDKTKFGISQSLFSIKYTTTIVCPGGALTLLKQGFGYLISGINSPAPAGCNGNYVVTYDIQVLQAPTTQFPTTTKSVQLTGGFKQYHELRDKTGNRFKFRAAILDNSNLDNFVTQVACTVDVSSTNITLPNYSTSNIVSNPSGSATPFTVNLRNCIGGGTSAPSVFVYWRFNPLHTSNSAMLANSDTTASGAKNIALSMYYVDQAQANKQISHQQRLDTGYKLPSDTSNTVSLRHYVQYVVTPEGQTSGVADGSKIQGGKFSGQAQLFVQYQ